MSDCAGCQHLENPHATNRVVLLSGSEVCTWCPAWKTECAERHQEALMVLRFHDRDVRIAHLARVESERGLVARERLAAEVLRIWEQRRAARAIA